MPERINLAPGSYVSGGLVDDVDVEITGASFVEWDYQGGDITVPALCLEFTDEESGEDYSQYYSAGNIEKVVPSKDGEYLESIGKQTAMVRSTNTASFMQSLVNAGYPEADLDGAPISALVGLRCHVNRVAQPKRTGLARRDDEDDRPKEILLVTKINSFPGEKKGKGKAKGKASTKSKGKAKDADESDSDLTEKTREKLLEAVMENDGSLKKAKFSTALYKLAKSDPDRNKMVQLAFSDDFLNAMVEDEMIEFDGATVSLPE